MEILKFVKSLLPTFGKDRLIEDARITRDELRNVVLVSYQAATPLIEATKYKSEELESLNQLFKRNYKAGKNGAMLATIAKDLENVIKFQEVIYDFIDKRFEKTIVIDGITIFKANIIQAQGMLSFVSKFASKLLNYAYVLECAALGYDSQYVKDNLSKGEIEEIHTSFLDFVNALAVVTRDEKEVIKQLSSVPDVVIGQNPEAIAAVYNESKTDPLQMRHVKGFSSSPILHFRMVVAELQVWRYKYMQDTKRVLELRLLSLQKAFENNPDPKLEKEISYTQSRIDNFAEKMRHAEEAVQ